MANEIDPFICLQFDLQRWRSNYLLWLNQSTAYPCRDGVIMASITPQKIHDAKTMAAAVIAMNTSAGEGYLKPPTERFNSAWNIVLLTMLWVYYRMWGREHHLLARRVAKLSCKNLSGGSSQINFRFPFKSKWEWSFRSPPAGFASRVCICQLGIHWSATCYT